MLWPLKNLRINLLQNITLSVTIHLVGMVYKSRTEGLGRIQGWVEAKAG